MVRILRINKSTGILIIAVVFILFGARAWSLYGDARIKLVNITLLSSVAGTAQLYYDLGQGYSEKDLSQTEIRNHPVFTEYHFPVPDEKIYKLRFDPLMSGGQVRIRQVRITDGLGNVFLNFDLKQLEPAHQIRELSVNGDLVSVAMDDPADDPQINLRFPPPLSLGRLHKAYFLRLSRDFLAIMFLVFIMVLWVKWQDPKHIKKWICTTAIMLGFATVTFYSWQILRDILNGSIRPIALGDTDVYLYMAAQKWTSPDFYQGLRQFGVPLLYSLVNGANNKQNIILLQMILSYAGWTSLAFVAVSVLKDDLTKTAVFLLIAFIPLNNSIHSWNTVILSESISFSFLAFFLGAYLWYFNTRSIPSILLLAVITFFFVLMRDTDAFLVLLMTPPILWILVQQIKKKAGTALRHGVLLSLFIFLFVGSMFSANDMHFNDSFPPPFTNNRQYFSLLNVMGQLILPFEDRIKFFEAHGLKVTPALMAREGTWASSDDWRWYHDPELAAQREWLYRYGKSTYAKYLLTHLGYVFSNAFHAREYLLFPMGQQDAWFHKTVTPVPTKWFSNFFINNERQLRFLLFILIFAVILVCVEHAGKRNEKTKVYSNHLYLISYLILIAVPYGLLCYHGDPMEVDRHALGNIIRLNVGVVLFYLFMIDVLMNKVRILEQPGEKDE